MNRKCCWEFKNCGREPGGRNAEELGVCPVAVDRELEGCCDADDICGKCWTEVGTLCGEEVQGLYAKKLGSCLKCDYFDRTNLWLFTE
ncbi:MAG: hypothetical protein M1497_04230 [Nitrospirae bacterium]|nr:hypothetical protein [Nitrospirota bacterium]